MRIERRPERVRVVAVVAEIQGGEILVNKAVINPARNQIVAHKIRKRLKDVDLRLGLMGPSRPVVNRKSQMVNEDVGDAGDRESPSQRAAVVNRVDLTRPDCSDYLSRIFGRLWPTINFLPILKLEFLRKRFQRRSFLTVTRCRFAKRHKLSPFLIRLYTGRGFRAWLPCLAMNCVTAATESGA